MLRDNQREGKKDQERKDGRMARKEAQGAERRCRVPRGNQTEGPKERMEQWKDRTLRAPSGNRARNERESSGAAGCHRTTKEKADRKLRAPSGNRAAPSGRGAALRAPSGRRAALQCATGAKEKARKKDGRMA